MKNSVQPTNYKVIATEYCSFLYFGDDVEVTIQLTELKTTTMVSQTIMLNGKLHQRDVKMDKDIDVSTKLFLACVKQINDLAFESLQVQN